MLKFFFLPFGLLLLLQFECCDGLSPEKPEPSTVPALTEGYKVGRTLLVYMMAENSLSYYSNEDLTEIKNGVAGVDDDSRLFVYVDNSDPKLLPAIYQYHYSGDSLYENKVYSFDEDMCSSDTATLGIVLDFILDKYPTEELDLVMWSHADGWLRGPDDDTMKRSIGIDNGLNDYGNNTSTTIEMEELASLLKRLPIKVDRIMFDACLMQCVEVAYALRDAVDWVIASPAEIPGPGAPYDKVVPAFFSNNNGVKGIIDVYRKFYDSQYAGVVLSAVSASHMHELAELTSVYVKKYLAKSNANAYNELMSYIPGGAYYKKPAYPAYYDMNAVMKSLLETDEYTAWRTVLDKAVPYLEISKSHAWYSSIIRSYVNVDVDECSGISMYVPQEAGFCSEFNEKFMTTEWYKAAGFDEAGW